MKAIILAAGKGVRMRPLTHETPKTLLKIKGKPIIEHIFNALPKEISEVMVVVKYLGDQIKNYLGTEFGGRKISFAEGSDKGTAYSFLATKSFINKERFLLLNGDEFPSTADIANCLKKDLSVITFQSYNSLAHGMVLLKSDRTILEVVEKPESWPTDIAVGGIYVLNEKIFNHQPTPNSKGEYYFSSMLSQFVKDYRVWPVPSIKFIGDVTTPNDIKRIEGLL